MPALPEILDVAIGVTFVFLLLSLVVTWLLELGASITGLRSKNLLNAVENLLDPTSPKLNGLQKVKETWESGDEWADKLQVGDWVAKLNTNAVKAFYEHPLIQGLAPPSKFPSYIPSREFGIALFDILKKAGVQALKYQTVREGSSFEEASQDVLYALKEGINQIKNETTKQALLTLIDSIEAQEKEAERRIAAVRQGFEDWFNASMERASGWYKRSAQMIALLIGIVLSVLINADTIALVQVLWRDSAIRTTVSGAAVAYIERGEEAKATEAQAQLQELALPIGWSFEIDDRNPATPIDPRDFPSTLEGWIWKIVGLVLTGFATSQGAPIWFDFLDRFVRIRGSGKKPEQSGRTVAEG